MRPGRKPRRDKKESSLASFTNFLCSYEHEFSDTAGAALSM